MASTHSMGRLAISLIQPARSTPCSRYPACAVTPAPGPPPGAARTVRLIRLPRLAARARPPDKPAPILVQARIRLDGQPHFIPAGTASPAIDPCGRHLLCIRIEALPANRRLYVPLQDVLALASEPPSVLDLDESEPHGHA